MMQRITFKSQRSCALPSRCAHGAAQQRMAPANHLQVDMLRHRAHASLHSLRTVQPLHHVHRSIIAQSTTANAPLDGDVSAILLAGGVGKRMGAPIPKQYLELRGRPIATYSLRTFASMPEVGEIVVVCEPEYDEVFVSAHADLIDAPPLVFARPGKERQDSVFNGLQAVRPSAALVAIHDSARPMMAADDVRKCIGDALQVGAAVLGVPVKPTIKEVAPDGSVVATLQRSKLWEVQTPQVIRPLLLHEGFALVREQGLEVTDDVSIVEAMGKPVRVTPGSYTNIKVTTPDDLLVAEKFLSQQTPTAVVSSA